MARGKVIFRSLWWALLIIGLTGLTDVRNQSKVIWGFGFGSNASLSLGIDRFSEALQEQKSIRVNIVRESIPWNEVETSPGVFRWEYKFPETPRDYHRMLEETETADIKVLEILAYGPSYDPELTREELLADWRRYVQTVVDEFGEEIDYWEIGNEPNSREFWGKVVAWGTKQRFDPDPQLFGQMLSNAYDIIKERDKNDLVVLGGLVTISETTPDCETNPFVYLGQLYKLGFWDKFDAIGFHPYWGGFNPEQPILRGRAHDPSNGDCLPGMRKDNLVQEVTAVCDLAKQFGEKPVWITELGWNQPDLEKLAGYRGNTPDEVEADFLVRSYVPLLSISCVDTLFWYTQVEDRPEENFVLGSPGKQAFQNLSVLLSGSTPLGQMQGQNDQGRKGDDDVYEYRFEKNGQLIIVAWKARGGDEPRNVTLTGIDFSYVKEYPSNAIEPISTGRVLAVIGGEVQVSLTESPMILISQGEATGAPDEEQPWWSNIEKSISDWINKYLNKLVDQINAWLLEQTRQASRDFFRQLCGTVLILPVFALLVLNKKRRR